jgi:hypothetical protein
MPRYKLRTLLIVLALGPVALAVVWFLTMENPPIAVLTVVWSALFLAVVIFDRGQVLRALGMSAVEWLAIVGIGIMLLALLNPGVPLPPPTSCLHF